ncbi:MAG: germination protein Ger(x)C family [Oscillospiraceae bacterium]|jgi:spore germination protein KC|nr:germination protein Ger(x)C family [Oscillospiraceae bacterium]
MSTSKKGILLILILSNIFIFTGCWNYSEIDEQVIVSAIAIDKGQNGKKFHVSAEIILIAQGSNAEVSTAIVESDGNTMLESLRNMISTTSQKLYHGQCKVMVIGKQLAREGIAETLDFPLRDHEVRKDMFVVVSQADTAQEILETEALINPVNGFEIDTVLNTDVGSLSQVKPVRVIDSINVLATEGKSLAVPTISLIKDNNEKKTTSLSGLAIFKRDKLIGFLSEEESKMYQFITDSVNNTALSVRTSEDSNDYVCFEVFENKTTVKPSKIKDALNFEIKINSEVSLDETQGFEIDGKKLGEIYTRNLKNRVENLIDNAKKFYKIDIFGFGHLLDLKNTKLWEKYKKNWDETFLKASFTVSPQVKVRGSGTTGEKIMVGD